MNPRRILLIAPLAILAAACATQPAAPVSVADTIARDPQLSTLNSLAAQAGLTDSFRQVGPITVFAPTNAAFKEVPAKTMDELAHDPVKLRAVLNYHVVPAKVLSAGMTNGNMKTAQGASVSLYRSGEFVTVDEAAVEHADIVATNGVVHTVDRVLMPPR